MCGGNTSSHKKLRAQDRFLASLNPWLEEPIEACLALSSDGEPCIESKSPVDIEESLGMYHGNIFHDAPTWPFAMTTEQAGAVPWRAPASGSDRADCDRGR